MGIINQVSPGIVVSEIDLTTIVPNVSTTRGAYVGSFHWGPVRKPRLIGDESELVRIFGEPKANNFSSSNTAFFETTSFFTCANFLAYSNALWVTRIVSDDANNAISNNVDGRAIRILDEDDYEERFYYNTNNGNAYGPFAARYIGEKGNGILVSVCGANSNTKIFNSWTYAKYFDGPPGTSDFAKGKKVSNDEIHVIVIDKLGKFTGKAGSVLEKFPYLSVAPDAVGVNQKTSYYKDVIKDRSEYIYVMDHPYYGNPNLPGYTANVKSSGNIGWGVSKDEFTNLWLETTAGAVNFANTVRSYWTMPRPINYGFYRGTNGGKVTPGLLMSGWDIYKNRDLYDISLMITGSASDISTAIPGYILDNIIEGTPGVFEFPVDSEDGIELNGEIVSDPILGRKDAVLFISPRYKDVVFQKNKEALNIVDDFLLNINRSSSYVVCDSGWKYQYDKYNDIYRWVPLNADIAGLCAATDLIRDPWWSPAGFNRGHIKNVARLAWNPGQAERDLLYQNGVNPVCSFRGEGTILFGDKTLQSKPSAFDRINVRRLFIVLEKAISEAAKYSLFEFNDIYTRADFVAMVEPYLQTIKSRRGIYDFKVVCDETNNTPDIIDRNGFVGDIYIKPARSINFIQLNFIAVRTGVDFNTVVGTY